MLLGKITLTKPEKGMAAKSFNMELDPFIPTFDEYQKKIRRAYEDFWQFKRELEQYYPAGPNKIWDFNDETMSMRKLKIETQEWEPYSEF